MEWDYIKQFHLNPPPTAVYLPRNKEVEVRYQQHKKEFKSIKDYILNTHFDSNSIDQGWVIVDNEFPYDCQSNIRHFLIWIYPGKELSDQQIIGIIQEYMNNNGHSEYAYFRNVPAIRSVLEIDHFHIFVKLADKFAPLLDDTELLLSK